MNSVSRIWGGMAVTLALATAAPASRADDTDRMREIISSRLGVTVTDDFARTFGIRGVLVLDAPDGSIGRRSGMKPGDLMLFFDGRPIRNSSDLAPQLVALDEGGRVRTEVYRRDRMHTLTVKLEPARRVRVERDVDRRRIVTEDVKKLRRGGRVAADGSDPADLGEVLRDVGRVVGRTIGRAIGRVEEAPDSSAHVIEIDMRHGIPDLGWQ
jgi:hypothetical protein